MSIDGRKSTVEELVMKYRREPSLEKSIYVEGSTDKILVRWFLKQAKIHNVIVNEINTLELNIQKVFDLGLDDNERGRVVTLTTLIDDKVIGIIDSDFDFLKEPSYPHNRNLCKTDYSCMEMYFFNEDTLEKILLGYQESIQPSNFIEFKIMLSEILSELFLIRFAKDNIQKDLPHIDFSKNIKKISKNLILERDKYLSKYVSFNADLIKRFNVFIAEMKTELPVDSRKIINGHDFIALAQIYLGIKQRDAIDTFQKSIYHLLEFDKLKEEEMFKNILLNLNYQL